jgi:thiol-disulfide isomerase/thioredoxin
VKRTLDEAVPDGPLIMHFWATWCVPCRRELPALARFQATLAADGGAGRLVVVSVDRFAFEKIETFLRDELGLANFPTWQDANGRAGTVFRLFGYPDTVLLDASHREIGRRAGSLEWDDPGVRNELMSHLGESN